MNGLPEIVIGERAREFKKAAPRRQIDLLLAELWQRVGMHVLDPKQTRRWPHQQLEQFVQERQGVLAITVANSINKGELPGILALSRTGDSSMGLAAAEDMRIIPAQLTVRPRICIGDSNKRYIMGIMPVLLPRWVGWSEGFELLELPEGTDTSARASRLAERILHIVYNLPDITSWEDQNPYTLKRNSTTSSGCMI